MCFPTLSVFYTSSNKLSAQLLLTHLVDSTIWASSGSWCWTGKSGFLQSMGLQRIGHDWVTELNWWGWNSHDGNTILTRREREISLSVCHVRTQCKGDCTPGRAFSGVLKGWQLDYLNSCRKKSGDKIQYSFVILKKTFHKVNVEEIYLSIIKAVYDKPIIIILWWKPGNISSKVRNKVKDIHSCHFYST